MKITTRLTLSALLMLPLAPAFGAGPEGTPRPPGPIACAARQPIALDIFEYGTQLGLVSPAQVVGPPGAPPPAPGAGTSSVMISDLKIGDQVVGTMNGFCITVGTAGPGGDEIQVCNQTLNLTHLPAPYDKLNGQIVVNGPIDRAAFHGRPDVAGDGVEQILPVVGGSGAFRAARGQLRVRESTFNEHVQVWSLAELLCL